MIGHEQRIAAREQHVAHLGVLLEIVECGVDAPAQRFELALAHQPAARAVAAIGGAGVEHQQQNAVRIAVDEALDDGGVVLAARVRHVARADQQLAVLGHDLEADGTVRVFGIDQRRPLGSDRDGKFFACQQQTATLRLREVQQLFELLDAGEPVAHLPVPVVPMVGIIGHAEGVADVLAPGGLDRIRGESLLLHFQAPLWK